MTQEQLEEFLKDHWLTELDSEDWDRVPHLFDEYGGEGMEDVTEEEYLKAIEIFQKSSNLHQL